MTAALDWTNLIVRVIHFAAGIAWIGSSFYFVWLDRALTIPSPPRPGVEGDVWMVHSGGFYLVERRRIGPGQMPAVLHWFKWEAALTWATGMVLLAVVYYLSGGAYLLDPAVSSLTTGQATVLSLGLLAAGWFVYDLVWRSPLGRTAWPAGAVSLALLAAVMFGLFATLSARAAYIHVGALLGTLMVANVWAVILPAQQQMIDATARGQQPDFSLGEQAKHRSMHNSYMTFPVLFTMVSSHFPQTYGHRLGWLILALLTIAGAAARHAMIGKGKHRSWALLPMVASLVAVIAMATPRPAGSTAASPGAALSAATFADARAVINTRCLACHSAYPTDSVFRAPPNGVAFDTPGQILHWAPRIHERAVVQQTMPLSNKTGMTRAEREALRRWTVPEPR
ncbi:MAG: urate hydroxylase PuuD [Gemmatimonadaceae bacterium]